MTGPAARKVLAEAKETGQLDHDRLIAAAEADASNPPPADETHHGP